jgi:hypothetical protein
MTQIPSARPSRTSSSQPLNGSAGRSGSAARATDMPQTLQITDIIRPDIRILTAAVAAAPWFMAANHPA